MTFDTEAAAIAFMNANGYSAELFKPRELLLSRRWMIWPRARA